MDCASYANLMFIRFVVVQIGGKEYSFFLIILG